MEDFLAEDLQHISIQIQQCEMILNECASPAVYSQNVLDCWIMKNCASVIQDTARSMFTNEAL